jgi:tetratricopeptide (TPR) repeat protein
MIQNRSVSTGLWVSLILLAILSVAHAAAWPVNKWAVTYLEHRLGAGATATIPEPPQEHDLAAVWLADEALEEGDVERARELVLPLTASPKNYVLFSTGNILNRTGNFTEAVQAWKKADAFETLIHAAWAAYNEFRLQDALLAGKAAWDIDPENGTTALASFMKQDGEWAAAQDLLSRMLQRYPNSEHKIYWLLNLGDIARRQKNWNKAETAYQQVISLAPQNAAAHIGLGWVYYERGDGATPAMHEFEQAIQKDPLQGEGYFAMAQILTKEQQYEEAEQWYKQALQQSPDNRQWQLYRANNLREANQLDTAIALYKTLLSSYPDWPPVYYELAWAYTLNDQYTEATNAILPALSSTQSPNGWYWYRAGEIYEKRGLYIDALTAYNKANDLILGNQSIINAISRLGNEK